MSVIGEAINWAKVKRRISNAAWISDKAALRQCLALCSGCQWKMPWRWKKTFHYAEFTAAHGVGTCDQCRNFLDVTLFVSTDDPWYAQCEQQARIAEEARADARSFAVQDRRRVVL